MGKTRDLGLEKLETEYLEYETFSSRQSHLDILIYTHTSLPSANLARAIIFQVPRYRLNLGYTSPHHIIHQYHSTTLHSISSGKFTSYIIRHSSSIIHCPLPIAHRLSSIVYRPPHPTHIDSLHRLLLLRDPSTTFRIIVPCINDPSLIRLLLYNTTHDSRCELIIITCRNQILTSPHLASSPPLRPSLENNYTWVHYTSQSLPFPSRHQEFSRLGFPTPNLGINPVSSHKSCIFLHVAFFIPSSNFGTKQASQRMHQIPHFNPAVKQSKTSQRLIITTI